jgi:sugar O-acyltransferase (sialic acid O-acetyltransferase NeuD family)
MTTPIVIVGAGGFGREVLDIIEATNRVAPTWDFLGFLDDGEPDEELLARRGAKHLGPTDRLADIDAQYVIGVGSGEVRARIDAQATSFGRQAATIIHPAAIFGSDIEVGEGSVVCALACLTTNVRLGRHLQINLGCTVGHDAVLEDYVTLFPGASISGNVTLGEGTSVGTRAAVLPGINVGAGASLGAGAVVVGSVLSGMTVVGVPARPVTPR